MLVLVLRRWKVETNVWFYQHHLLGSLATVIEIRVLTFGALVFAFAPTQLANRLPWRASAILVRLGTFFTGSWRTRI